MAIKITTVMLDQFGRDGHSYMGCLRVRRMLDQAGVTDVELHVYEIQEVNRLRAEAEQITEMADAIEARGPWPDREAVSDADAGS